MPTSQQAAASHANSSKSSGHSATEGQAASRYNAAKHGIVAIHQIMFDESVEDLAELAAEYHEHHSPADSDQRTAKRINSGPDFNFNFALMLARWTSTVLTLR